MHTRACVAACRKQRGNVSTWDALHTSAERETRGRRLGRALVNALPAQVWLMRDVEIAMLNVSVKVWL